MDKYPTPKLPIDARRAAWLALLMIGSALTEGIGLILLIPMLSVLGADQAGGSGITALLEKLAIPLTLGPLLALFVGLVLLRGAIQFAQSIAALRFETSLVDSLRRRAWSALLHCDWRVLVTMRQTDNASLLITNVDRIGNGVHQLLAAAAAAVTLGGIGLAAMAISPRISLAALASGALVLFLYRHMRRRAAALGRALDDAYIAVHGRISEGLGALRVIKSFGREARAEADGDAGLAALRRSELAYRRDVGIGRMALHGGGALSLAVIVWTGINQWHVGAATVLPLVALFARALPLLGALQEAWQNWEHVRPTIASTLGLIARAEAAREPDAQDTAAPALERAIELAGVTVQFPGRDRPALRHVTVSIPARRITAVVGPSGAGKSTVADLLGGMIAPDEGRVTVDGMALEGGLRRAWRTRVTYVQQDPVLFAGTIRENLAWADPGASDGAIRQALADASAGFVEALSDGLDTQVGEGGRQLSGGERQRIALARALLREPELLILDEATSALDAENERAIAEAVLRLRGRTTVLIIGHRGSLPALADLTITLEAGELVSSVVQVKNPADR